MKLEQIELRLLSLPMKQPFETSFGVTREKTFLLVMVRAESLTGYGECVADTSPFYLPETVETARHVIRDFIAPLSLQAGFEHPRELGALLSRVRGHEMAKAAVEMAVFDLYAKREGVSLARALGGDKQRIAAGVSIGLQPDDATLCDQVEQELASGYRRIKVKIKPGRDLSSLAALKHRFPELCVVADANSAYKLGDAPRLRELDAFEPLMLEQPLAWDDILEHAQLSRLIRTPICLDESLHSARDVSQALDQGACRIVNLKPGRVGGLAESLRIHDLCVARGVPLWCGGMVESGIGRLANIHLQSLPGFSLPGDTSDPARYFQEDLVEPPIRVKADGTIDVPTGPGLGHEVVLARLEKATREREVLQA